MTQDISKKSYSEALLTNVTCSVVFYRQFYLWRKRQWKLSKGDSYDYCRKT